MPSVYILQSIRNDSYYVGSTKHLKERLREHKQGKSRYTRHICPLKLVFSQEFPSLRDARKVEYRLKKLKSRDILERIIKDGEIRFVRE